MKEGLGKDGDEEECKGPEILTPDGTWEDVPLKNLKTIAKALETEKKHCIVKFTNESAASFCSYQTTLTIKEFHKDVCKISLGSLTEEEA